MPMPRRSAARDALDTLSGPEVLLVSREGLQAFIAESEQMLQEFTIEIHSVHREFVNALMEGMSINQPPAKQTSAEAAFLVPNSEGGFASSFLRKSRVSAQVTATSMQLEPALSEKTFKEAMNEILPACKIMESVSSLLLPIERDLKCMATAFTDVQASMDHLEKSSVQESATALSSPASDASRRDLRAGPEEVESNADKQVKIPSSQDMMTPTPSAMAEEMGLAHAKTNMNFAADMLGRLSENHREEFLAQMDKCELPAMCYDRSDRACCHHMEPQRHGPLAQALRSDWFHHGISLVIILNAVFITYSADYAVRHPMVHMSDWSIYWFEVIFHTIFFIEVVLRISVHRLYFFINKDFMWNNLDIILVFGACYDLVMTHLNTTEDDAEAVFGANNGWSLTFIRILRLLKFTKVLRVFRVMRIFSELNVLIHVVRAAFRPLIWSAISLTTFFYSFAVVFTHGTAVYLMQPDAELGSEETAELMDYWGSVSLSMLSLFIATTGGADWHDVAKPLRLTGDLFYGLFLFFIAFVILALLNILTGLFVDRAMRAVNDDKDGMAVQKVQENRAVSEDLYRIFCAISGEAVTSETTICQEQFEEFMRSPMMRARLAVLDLEIWDSAKFFKMLTAISDKSLIDLTTFMTGCMQLRGTATKSAVQAVHAEVASIKYHVKAAQLYQYELGRQLLEKAAPSTS